MLTGNISLQMDTPQPSSYPPPCQRRRQSRVLAADGTVAAEAHHRADPPTRGVGVEVEDLASRREVHRAPVAHLAVALRVFALGVVRRSVTLSVGAARPVGRTVGVAILSAPGGGSGLLRCHTGFCTTFVSSFGQTGKDPPDSTAIHQIRANVGRHRAKLDRIRTKLADSALRKLAKIGPNLDKLAKCFPTSTKKRTKSCQVRPNLPNGCRVWAKFGRNRATVARKCPNCGQIRPASPYSDRKPAEIGPDSAGTKICRHRLKLVESMPRFAQVGSNSFETEQVQDDPAQEMATKRGSVLLRASRVAPEVRSGGLSGNARTKLEL